jgi:D-sedoheptulose 7-phosphate isomerase
MDLEQSLSLYREKLISAEKSVDLKSVLGVVNIIRHGIEKDATVFIAGNGGSASTASHFAVDLGVGSLKYGLKVKVYSLMDNSGVITATANDFDFQEIVTKQLSHLATENDVLIVISASGNSVNLKNAVELANNLGVHTISFTGFQGGMLQKIARHNVHVSTEVGEYGIVEDIHLSICHRITETLRMGGEKQC